jgi:hypothetical protein
LLSSILIISQVAIIGRVGGDNDAYVERGLLALEDPSILILNEPITVLFAYLSELLKIPLPNLYITLTNTLLLYALSSSKSRIIYVIAYTLFVIPISVGYLRQGLAVSILLLLYMRGAGVAMLFRSIIAVVAHPSAILPVALFQFGRILGSNSMRFKVILLTVGVGVFIYAYDSLSHYLTHYTAESEMESSGYIFRLITYTVILTACSFTTAVRLYKTEIQYQAWLITILSVIISYLFSTTAADRVLVFVLPLIMLMASNASALIEKFIALISIFYFSGWLLLSPHAKANWQYEIFLMK